jgi:UDP-hydrolysing UDP-N-acetyl-D-glucosamine 2-epimerase
MIKKQNVAVLTTARAEYYQLKGLLRNIQKSKLLTLQLFVSGSHLSSRHGKLEDDIIEKDRFSVCERLPIIVDEDSGLGAAFTASLALQTVAAALYRNHSDLLILAGDRFESLAAAQAAMCVGVPIAHLHGGELTEGAMDDMCRHAITKLSAAHFVSTEVYRARVIQMGEPAERVFNVGALPLDEVAAIEPISKKQLSKELAMPIKHPLSLVAYHPATREKTDHATTIRETLNILAKMCKTIIITEPNQDPGREQILNEMRKFAESCPHAKCFTNLGSAIFLSVMKHADIMVGNSSSSLHEAASFRLPVVNIGFRQAERLCPRNVVNCSSNVESIRQAISQALSKNFREQLYDLKNPFGDGHAGERIVAELEKLIPFSEKLYRKSFSDSISVQSALQDWRREHG